MTFSVSCWHPEMVKSDQERVNPRLPEGVSHFPDLALYLCVEHLPWATCTSSITVWVLPFCTWHTQAPTAPRACSRYAPESAVDSIRSAASMCVSH